MALLFAAIASGRGVRRHATHDPAAFMAVDGIFEAAVEEALVVQRAMRA